MIINSNTAAANLLTGTLSAPKKPISNNPAAPIGADQAELSSVSDENLTAAGDPITDEDTARETAESVRQMIMAQNSMAMIAQANSVPLRALRLLQQ